MTARWQPSFSESLALLWCLETYKHADNPEQPAQHLTELIGNIVRAQREEAAQHALWQEHRRGIEQLGAGRFSGGFSPGGDGCDPDPGGPDMTTNAAKHRDITMRLAIQRSVGIKLRRARMDLGIDIPELAQRAQVTRDSIQKAESGATLPTFITAHRLCRALGITLDSLAEGIE